MNTELALKTIEALEPYARRLIEQAERKGPAYRTRWFLALQQAELVVAAYDAPEEPGETPEGLSTGPSTGSGDTSRRGAAAGS